jgi:phospholipid N-methyltransferase
MPSAPGKLAHRLRPGLVFARGFLANPRRVGSVIPSSPRLVARLLDGLEWTSITTCVEYGPGTGVVTRAALERLRPDGRLIAFELNPDFAAFLARDIADPRLTVLAASAEAVAAHVPAPACAVVSSLPFSIMPRAVVHGILGATAAVLAPGAPLVGYQYSTARVNGLRDHFREVGLVFEPRNWPPAFVFTARN